MARGTPQKNGAPSSSGTPRPGSNYANTQGPGGFKGNSKHTAESSGDIRSTGPSHRRPIATARQSGEGIAGDLKDSHRMGGGSFADGPPRASKSTDVSANVKQNQLGNAHGGQAIAGAPPKAR